jgi:protein-L-isoaspartate(D-aspartate) O-methyltransferase
MLETQLVVRGISDERVLSAMGDIPREEFVADSERNRCYYDEPVSIGYGQTLSQPYMTALMAECLHLTGTEKVLEVGGGCGYHAAVLGRLARDVFTIEIVPELAALARHNLDCAGADGNVQVICGDGSLGLPEHAPFDAISVACAAPEVPSALQEQLADGGRLVIPVGTLRDQDLLLIEREGNSFLRQRITLCRFVPLIGRQGWHS